MLRDVAEPGDAGGLLGQGRRLKYEGRISVFILHHSDFILSRHGAVDDGLLLLVQQPNQLPLGADEGVDLPVRVVQKSHDGRLFVGRRENRLDAPKVIRIKTETAFNDTC